MTIEPILPAKTTQKIKRLTCFLNFSLNPPNAVILDPELGLELSLKRYKETNRVDGYRLATPSNVKATADQSIIPEGQRFISC
jgi:hypothetical protein